MMEFVIPETAMLTKDNGVNRTVEESKKCWCPFATARVVRFAVQNAEGQSAEGQSAMINEHSRVPETVCIADSCMAWRWDTATDERGHLRKLFGYCGLVGSPTVTK